MLSRVSAAAVLGIQAFPVLVEVDLQSGLPSFSTVGLPDEAVRESRDRVRAAIMNSGYAFPSSRVTVNLAPADLRKEGSGFDLAIAVGLLAAQGLVRLEAAADLLLVGELSLDGGLKPVRGVLPVAIAARERGYRGVVLPPESAAEAALVREVEVYPARRLEDVVAAFNGGRQLVRSTAGRTVGCRCHRRNAARRGARPGVRAPGAGGFGGRRPQHPACGAARDRQDDA